MLDGGKEGMDETSLRLEMKTSMDIHRLMRLRQKDQLQLHAQQELEQQQQRQVQVQAQHGEGEGKGKGKHLAGSSDPFALTPTPEGGAATKPSATDASSSSASATEHSLFGKPAGATRSPGTPGSSSNGATGLGAPMLPAPPPTGVREAGDLDPAMGNSLGGVGSGGGGSGQGGLSPPSVLATDVDGPQPLISNDLYWDDDTLDLQLFSFLLDAPPHG